MRENAKPIPNSAKARIFKINGEWRVNGYWLKEGEKVPVIKATDGSHLHVLITKILEKSRDGKIRLQQVGSPTRRTTKHTRLSTQMRNNTPRKSSALTNRRRIGLTDGADFDFGGVSVTLDAAVLPCPKTIFR